MSNPLLYCTSDRGCLRDDVAPCLRACLRVSRVAIGIKNKRIEYSLHYYRVGMVIMFGVGCFVTWFVRKYRERAAAGSWHVYTKVITIVLLAVGLQLPVWVDFHMYSQQVGSWQPARLTKCGRAYKQRHFES
jgi:hypothetical protein